MAADGVDPTDQAQLDAWTEQFNARPFHEREALTGGPHPESAPEIDDEPLRARPRPDADVVATIAAHAPILARMLKLSEYLGDGRPLTKKGNLKLADARALVELLETGDVLEETVGDRTYTPRSAEHIRGLDTIVEWAKAARVVRIVKGSMLGTASFRKLARDPVAGLNRLVDTLFEVGPLADPPTVGASLPRALDFFTDAAIHGMVMSAYELDDPLEFEALVTRTVEVAVRSFSLPEWMDEIDDAVIDLLAEDEAPPFTQDDERTVYAVATELAATGKLADATFAAGHAVLADRGMGLELVSLVGYYVLVCFTLNVLEVELPKGEAKIWSD